MRISAAQRCVRTPCEDLPVSPAAITQSSTIFMIGMLPTGIMAFDETLVPSLKGYKLVCQDFHHSAVETGTYLSP